MSEVVRVAPIETCEPLSKAEHLKTLESYKGLIADYARAHGLVPQDVYKWRASQKKSVATKIHVAKTSQFVRAEVRPSPKPNSSLQINLNSGVQLSFEGELDRELVCSVVEVLK